MSGVGSLNERQPGDIVSELAAMNVEVDHDVMRIAPRLWALHGQVAYDGEVIAAVFASEHEAWFALSKEPEPPSAAPATEEPCAR